MPLANEDKNGSATTIQTNEEGTANLTQLGANSEGTAGLMAREFAIDRAAIVAALRASGERTALAIEASGNRLVIAFEELASPLVIKVRAHSMAIGAFDGEKESSIEQGRKLEELRRTTAELKTRIEDLEQRLPKAS